MYIHNYISYGMFYVHLYKNGKKGQRSYGVLYDEVDYVSLSTYTKTLLMNLFPQTIYIA